MKTSRSLAALLLSVFTLSSLIGTTPAYADNNTGTIKIFSEVKGIEIFLDEQPQGKDMVELKNVEAGSHYVKAVKAGITIYSDLANVTANTTTTILIKDNGQVKEKILDSKFKEQTEYKEKRLDILLSKGMQTTGTAYTSTYFPGYYSAFGSSWTNLSATAYETTDWKIVQGGVQEISDVQFATLVNDSAALKKYQEQTDFYSSKYNTGAIVALIGLASLVGGAVTTGDTQIGLLAVGLVGCVFGYGFMATDTPPPGHLTTPAEAAKMAHEYDQGLKVKLGLPENYEP